MGVIVALNGSRDGRAQILERASNVAGQDVWALTWTVIESVCPHARACIAPWAAAQDELRAQAPPAAPGTGGAAAAAAASDAADASKRDAVSVAGRGTPAASTSSSVAAAAAAAAAAPTGVADADGIGGGGDAVCGESGATV
jgi:hypothetical protein